MKKIILIIVTIFLIFIIGFSFKKDESKKIVVSEVTHSVFYSPLYVAIEKGYFQDENIDIELILTPGADKVSTYDTVVYSIENKIGKWEVQSKKVKIISQNGNSVTLEITTGKSGEFDLIFNADDSTQSIKHIIIESL